MASNLKALIIDPSSDSRAHVSRSVEAIGLDLASAVAYGSEATFLASHEHPDVILMALEDPPVRGLSTLAALQQRRPDIPVLVYSSGMTSPLMRQAMRAGARDFLEKPIRVGELQDAIHTVLAQEGRRQSARCLGSNTAGTARGTIITIAGAKGGIGKTTFAVNLATMLREVTGQEVALIDADAQFGDVAMMLDMEAHRSIADLARDEVEINRQTVRSYLVRSKGALNVLAATAEPDDWRALQPESVSAIARSLAESHEYVVVDTPGVMNEVVAACLNEAAVVLLVTSLDAASLKDTQTAVRMLDMWGMPSERLRLVVNNSTDAAVVRSEAVERATGIKVSMVMPHDAGVGLSVQTGIPIVRSRPASPYALAVREITEGVTGVGARGVAHQAPASFRQPLLGATG